MNPKIDTINLGVSDLQGTSRFYQHVFGGSLQNGGRTPLISFGASASPLALSTWESVAADAGVRPDSSGFRAFTLSYIVDSADAVDELLERAERHGGRISKPPKNAVWGYSAYVTDPSGYLWKIASSKRRPLLGRRGSAVGNGNTPITPKEVPITIGVADMRRSKEFYADGVGLPVKKAYGNKFVMFGGDSGASDLGMYKREALADDAAVEPQGSGFHGFSLTHAVGSAERVNDLLARVQSAGARIIKPPAGDGGSSYGGSFADLDGNVWLVTTQ